MSKWFTKKKEENVSDTKSSIIDYSPTLEKLETLIEKMVTLSDKVNILEDKLNRLIESNKLLLEYYSTRDQRDVNYMIRSYNLKNTEKQPINFVPAKSGL